MPPDVKESTAVIFDRIRLVVPAILGLAALLSAIPSAHADLIIPEHATAYVFGHAGQFNNPAATDGPNSGSLTAQAAAAVSAPGEYFPEATISVAGAASVLQVPTGSTGGTTWELNAWAALEQTNIQTPFGNESGSTIATATWRDVLILSDTDPGIVGHTVRLTFRSEGTLVAESTNPNYFGAGTASVGTNAIAQYRDLYSSGGAGISRSTPGDFSYSGWDSLVVSGDHYSGTWHFDVAIDEFDGYQNIPGGLYFELSLTASTSSSGSDVNVYAADPLSFSSITLPDVGNVTPESLGVGITFDSGIASPNAQAVPEPSSLLLMGTGALGLLGYGWRRRRASRAGCARSARIGRVRPPGSAQEDGSRPTPGEHRGV
jgi:hypothetical protein